MSTKFVIGNIVRLKTRQLYAMINPFLHWDQKISFTGAPNAVKELFYWKENFQRLNVRQLRTSYRPPIKIFSDASSTGLGAHISGLNTSFVAKQNFTIEQGQRSSTWRELYAISFSLAAFVPYLQGEKVLWHTDNVAATSIIKHGSSKPDLQHLSEEIFQLCSDHNIDFKVMWIRRTFLSHADSLSKAVDYDDWETTPEFYTFLNSRWGPFTLDCFADNQNKKVPRFYSRYHCPYSLGVNAFYSNWEGENVYLVPPIYLIPDTIRHIEYCRVPGVLVVPDWPSAVFYPLLFFEGSLKPFFTEALYFTDSQTCFGPGKREEELVGSSRNKSGFIALKIEFV